jgi:hypothetical protein
VSIKGSGFKELPPCKQVFQIAEATLLAVQARCMTKHVP